MRHERVRKYVDQLANHVHDKVSAAYYDQTDFVLAGHNFGVPTDQQFERWHALSHDIALLVRHRANKYLANTSGFTPIDEDEYRYDTADASVDRVADAQARLATALGNAPAGVATHEFTIEDPRDGTELTITLQHLATFDLTL